MQTSTKDLAKEVTSFSFRSVQILIDACQTENQKRRELIQDIDHFLETKKDLLPLIVYGALLDLKNNQNHLISETENLISAAKFAIAQADKLIQVLGKSKESDEQKTQDSF